MDNSGKQEKPSIGDPTYQDRDINLSVISIGIVVVLALAVLSAVAMRILFKQYEQRMYKPMDAQAAFAGPVERPPAPLLQVNEAMDLRTFRAKEDAILTSYAWVDKPAGIARIPVREAVAIVAKRGLPVWTAPAAVTNAP